MHAKFLKLSSLFLVSTLATLGPASAQNINVSGTVCQNFNAAQALDIDYFQTGVRNINTAPRPVICSLPRSPLPAGVIPRFFVDGQNAANTSTTCTLETYTFAGVLTQTLTFTESGGATGRTWDHGVPFPLNSVGTFDYASVLCTLPGGGGGLIFGILSLQ